MARKLASIQKIKDLQLIPKADKILSAKVLGWNCVVGKDEFKIGDFCIFFEIDSILPEGKPWSEFLRSKKFRVKTIRLRGILSQGLALPISILPPDFSFNEGDDVTDILDIKKYEPQDLSRALGTIGPFPSFIRKTDEPRIQSNLELLDLIKGKPYYISVKYDGTSSTFGKYNNEFYMCSRSRRIGGEHTAHFGRIAKKYNLEEVIPDGFIIQGEICGPKIQGNKLNLSEEDLFVFNVFNLWENRYLNYDEFIGFCNQHNLQHVKIDLVSEEGFNYSVDELLEMAKGKYDSGKNREGIVIRPLKAELTPQFELLSFKVINNDFLLFDEE